MVILNLFDYSIHRHYRWNAFSKNGLPTITSNVRGVNTIDIGTKGVLSDIDIKKVKLFYGCP